MTQENHMSNSCTYIPLATQLHSSVPATQSNLDLLNNILLIDCSSLSGVGVLNLLIVNFITQLKTVQLYHLPHNEVGQCWPGRCGRPAFRAQLEHS